MYFNTNNLIKGFHQDSFWLHHYILNQAALFFIGTTTL
jgi:hypothetical protein